MSNISNKKAINSEIISIKPISDLVKKSEEKNAGFLTKPKFYSDNSNSLFICFCEFQLPLYQKKMFQELGIYFPSELLPAVNKRQAEFLAGRYVSQQAMLKSGLLNSNSPLIKAPTIEIGKNRSPVWPPGIKGSITHNTSEAICAITLDTPTNKSYIGIDVESFLTLETVSEIKNTIHTATESDLLISQGMPENLATTLIFSAKESLFKALYPVIGEYFGFECAEVIEFSINKTCLVFKITEELAAKANIKKTYHCEYFLREESLITLIHGSH
jgi:enterobactin synthetase component D